MWITVDNKRKSVGLTLGISQLLVKGLNVRPSFPQLSPQGVKEQIKEGAALVSAFICNYKGVISVTNISTAVITTNFKYKTFSWRVRPAQLAGI